MIYHSRGRNISRPRLWYITAVAVMYYSSSRNICLHNTPPPKPHNPAWVKPSPFTLSKSKTRCKLHKITDHPDIVIGRKARDRWHPLIHHRVVDLWVEGEDLGHHRCHLPVDRNIRWWYAKNEHTEKIVLKFYNLSSYTICDSTNTERVYYLVDGVD